MKNFLHAARFITLMALLGGLGVLFCSKLSYAQAVPASTTPAIAITVLDLTTGNQIRNGETITAGDQFQATVTVTNNIDCAGQFVVTALGAPGTYPEVVVQAVPFIIGPASGSDSVTGEPLTSNPNQWKVSASCDGALSGNAFGFSKFHFSAAD